MRPEEMHATVRDVLEERGTQVAAAWVFGSTARGTAGPASDVDVALLFASDRAPSSLEDLPTDVEEELTRRLGKPAQIIDIARVPDDLVHRVLRDGILLVENDRARRVAFEVASRNRYFEMVPIWRRYREGAARE